MKSWLGFSQLARTDRHAKPGAGYTIMETLVVLAVTTMLFAAISITFNGRSARTQFTQAVRSYEARLQSVITDVSNGNYSSDSAPPGTDSDRIFLGKMIAADTETNEVLTVFGRRSISGAVGADTQTLLQAEPTVAGSLNSNFANNYGLEIDNITRIGSGEVFGVFGFLNRLSSGSLIGANSLVQLYAVTGTSVPTTRASAITAIDTPGNLVLVPQGLRICITGGNNQRARITVGANNSQTGVFSEILEAGAACT